MSTQEEQRHVVGLCRFMCPESETGLREREGLLHKFERVDDGKIPGKDIISLNSSSSRIRRQNENTNFTSRGSGIGEFSNRRNLPKADIMKTVKPFSRSAAGLDKTSPYDLRPPHVLLQTVYYLCTEVLTRIDEPLNVVYDFIFDRLRSVRQDMVIQRICDITAIRILETAVRFHVYSAFRFRDEPIQIFDPYINTRHLLDCLKRLINLYESNDYWEASRNEFEALYVISCPDTSHVISRALSIRCIINDEIFNTAIEMSLAYQFRNYVKYFRKATVLPPLLASYVVQHTTYMRRMAFQVMSVAYGSNTCKFPLQLLTSLLLFKTIKEVKLNLLQIGIQIINDGSVTFARFSKTNASDNSLKTNEISYELNLPADELMAPENIDFIAKELICPWKDVMVQE